jgi:hypothetical protein
MRRQTVEDVTRRCRIVGDGCWVPPQRPQPNGYVKVRIGGAWVYAHRAAYELLKGPITEGLQLDHLCRNRACCNPDHLEAVTLQENIRRGERATRTECVNGHAFDEANTYIRLDTGCRQCNACSRERMRRRRQVRRPHGAE